MKQFSEVETKLLQELCVSMCVGVDLSLLRDFTLSKEVEEISIECSLYHYHNTGISTFRIRLEDVDIVGLRCRSYLVPHLLPNIMSTLTP